MADRGACPAGGWRGNGYAARACAAERGVPARPPGLGNGDLRGRYWAGGAGRPGPLLAIPLVLGRIQESYGPRGALDIPGLGLGACAALGLVWGLVRGNSAGWGSPEVVAALAAGTLLAALFVARELRARLPMLPMRLFRSRAFSAGNAAIFFLNASLTGAVFFMAQFQQTTLGQGPLDAGLRLLPWGVTPFLIAARAGALADRLGERPLIVAGLLLQTAGMAWIAVIARPGLAYAAMIAPMTERYRQGSGCLQHDAPAWRRVRGRYPGRCLRRHGQLRLLPRIQQRVRARHRRRRRAFPRRGSRRPGPAPAARSDRERPGPLRSGAAIAQVANGSFHDHGGSWGSWHPKSSAIMEGRHSGRAVRGSQGVGRDAAPSYGSGSAIVNTVCPGWLVISTRPP